MDNDNPASGSSSSAPETTRSPEPAAAPEAAKPASETGAGETSISAPESTEATQTAPVPAASVPSREPSRVSSSATSARAAGPASDKPEDVKAYRDGVHERAETERSLGHGAEPPRANPGATE